MPSIDKRFFNHSTGYDYKSGIYKANGILLALQKANFTFHRNNSSSSSLEELHSPTEHLILSTVYGSEDSTNPCDPRGHMISLLMAFPQTDTPSTPNERELRCTEQQTELSCRLSPGIQSPGMEGVTRSSEYPPAPPPGRPLSILGSVCAALLAKQTAPAKETASASSPICRICYGGGSGARLVRPCACRGTVAAVHRACLERWLLAAATSYCELCRHHYRVTRRHKWSVWRSLWEWVVCGGGRALAADAARGALLAAASVLCTTRVLHTADALLHVAAAKGGAAALAANVFSSVLIGIIGALNGLLTTWMLLKMQEHQASWRAWRDSTVLVRVALDDSAPPTPPITPPTTTSNASFSTVVGNPAESTTERVNNHNSSFQNLPDT